MLKDLVKLANRLDSIGLQKEADFLDSIIKKALHNDAKDNLPSDPEVRYEMEKEMLLIGINHPEVPESQKEWIRKRLEKIEKQREERLAKK